MKHFFFRLSVAIFSFLAGNGFGAPSWGHYQHDTAHTGRTHAPVDPPSLALAWSAQDFYVAPLIVGDTLYARRLDGLSTVVTAFSLNDGQVKWSYFGEDIYFGYVQVAGDVVVLDGFDYGGIFFDTLSVLNRKTGQFLYKVVLPFKFALTDLTLHRDPQSGDITAYCKSFETLVAVHLGKAGGYYLWTEAGDFGDRSIPTVIENSVVVFGGGSGTALHRATGAQNVFFIDSDGNSTSGAPAVYNSRRKDFYVKLDYQAQGETRVMAFHYNSQNSIDLLWTRTTPFSQFGGAVAIGPEGNLYSVGSDELAIIDPNDGSTIRRVPFLFGTFNGCTPALTRGVVWIYSGTQTYTYDSRTLELLRIFDGSPGSSFGFDPVGAFIPGTAALNTANNGGVSVYRSQSLLGIR